MYRYYKNFPGSVYPWSRVHSREYPSYASDVRYISPMHNKSPDDSVWGVEVLYRVSLRRKHSPQEYDFVRLLLLFQTFYNVLFLCFYYFLFLEALSSRKSRNRGFTFFPYIFFISTLYLFFYIPRYYRSSFSCDRWWNFFMISLFEIVASS